MIDDKLKCYDMCGKSVHENVRCFQGGTSRDFY
jgi:hypothetical protein